ncbi:hypothetical protein QUB05_22325 [Microcoleus sp. F10-C6]|uniref:hypothetical protein n=1 Tax=unclassified Microcoleus TaxID=2642155 RepID=UPI002FCEF103
MVNLKEKITQIAEIVSPFANFITQNFKKNYSLSLKLVTIGLLVASLELLAPMSANAQGQVVAEPAQVTVSGMRGSLATRNIVLQTDTPINNLQLIPLDLNRSDGDSIFPAQAISVEKPSVSSTNQNLMMTLVKFDLNKVLRSGEFNGKLWLSYQGGEQVIPLTIKVKDHWFLPLLILLVGSALGISVSIYRTQGRPRDEILVRVSQVRIQMQDDADFIKFEAFKARVEAHLIDVKMALQGERWDEAKNAVQQAELVESKWLKGRADWLAQLGYSDEIKQQLQDLDRSVPFVQTVHRSLEDALRDAPDLDSPVQLRDRLQELAEQVNSYLSLQAKIKKLHSLSEELSVEQAKNWQPKVQNLEQRIESLQPADLTKDANLRDEVEGAIAEITELLSQQADMVDSTELDFGVNVTGAIAKGVQIRDIMINLLGPAPSTSLLSWEEQASGANVRLKVFTVSSYIIAIVFLAGAGFSQLYVDKPTFGNNPWNDYSALMAWGFGAEATRDAVTKVVQGWSLPGLK